MLVAEKPLKTYLQKYFGFDKFKGEQEEIVQSVLAGKDTFVIMPTGGGKSMCYQLPSLIMDGTAVVVSPLIALMKNQVDAMRGSAMQMVLPILNSSPTKQKLLRSKRILNQVVPNCYM